MLCGEAPRGAATGAVFLSRREEMGWDTQMEGRTERVERSLTSGEVGYTDTTVGFGS